MDFASADSAGGGGSAAGAADGGVMDIEACIHESISGTDLQDLVDSICGLPQSSAGFRRYGDIFIFYFLRFKKVGTLHHNLR